jgi:hypothetical protein
MREGAEPRRRGVRHRIWAAARGVEAARVPGQTPAGDGATPGARVDAGVRVKEHNMLAFREI